MTWPSIVGWPGAVEKAPPWRMAELPEPPALSTVKRYVPPIAASVSTTPCSETRAPCVVVLISQRSGPSLADEPTDASAAPVSPRPTMAGTIRLRLLRVVNIAVLPNWGRPWPKNDWHSPAPDPAQ